MKTRNLNWQLWTGIVLCWFALLSYPLLFVKWPITRDFPWANLLMMVVAVVLMFFGIKRAFGPDRRRISKIAASIVTTLSILGVGLFIFGILIMSRWLPPSTGAPQVGQKAPDFSLTDTSGRTVSLSELLTAPVDGTAAGTKPKGVLLIFYRGYW